LFTFDEFFQNSVKIRPATRNRKPKDQKMKWKERVGITLAVSVVLVTSVLVLDIRLAQIRQDRNELHQQQQQYGDQLLVDAPVAHGRVRQKEGRQFQRRFLNRTSNETVAPPTTKSTTAASVIRSKAEDAEPIVDNAHVNEEEAGQRLANLFCTTAAKCHNQ
jgi:hypothetical protein